MREFHLRGLAHIDRRARASLEIEGAGHDVGVRVGLRNVGDPDIVEARQTQEDIDGPRGLDTAADRASGR